MAAYYIVNKVDQLPCQLLFVITPNARAVQVSLGYVIFVAVVCFILAAATVAFGVSFLTSAWRTLMDLSKSDSSVLRMLGVTFLLMFLFPMCFIAKSVLLLVAEYNEEFSVPIIVFAVLEQIPSAVLLFYLFPNIKNVKTSSLSKSSKKSKKKTTK